MDSAVKKQTKTKKQKKNQPKNKFYSPKTCSMPILHSLVKIYADYAKAKTKLKTSNYQTE